MNDEQLAVWQQSTELCVECPVCAFTFSADHTDIDEKTYSCAECAQEALERALADARLEVEELRGVLHGDKGAITDQREIITSLRAEVATSLRVQLRLREERQYAERERNAVEAEVARLTEERDRLQRHHDAHYSEVKEECDDIGRLLEAAEAVLAKACLTGRPGEDGYSYQVGADGSEALQALADTLAEMRERYEEEP